MKAKRRSSTSSEPKKKLTARRRKRSTESKENSTAGNRRKSKSERYPAVKETIPGTKDAGDFWFRWHNGILYVRTPDDVYKRTGVSLDLSVSVSPWLSEQAAGRVVSCLKDFFPLVKDRLNELLESEVKQ